MRSSLRSICRGGAGLEGEAVGGGSLRRKRHHPQTAGDWRYAVRQLNAVLRAALEELVQNFALRQAGLDKFQHLLQAQPQLSPLGPGAAMTARKAWARRPKRWRL